jgi:hypothetical protein
MTDKADDVLLNGRKLLVDDGIGVIHFLHLVFGWPYKTHGYTHTSGNRNYFVRHVLLRREALVLNNSSVPCFYSPIFLSLP